jgi:hypothetical protein
VVHILDARARQESGHRPDDVISLHIDSDVGCVAMRGGDDEQADRKIFVYWLHDAFSYIGGE